jgi:hypothetical protein
MSKAKPAASYAHVTPQLINSVKAVIADADKHKYSVSRVYGAHNGAFQKRDQPQTCSSCLRNRVRELRAWLQGYEKTQGVAPAAVTGESAEPYEKLFNDFMEGRQINEHSTAEKQRAALLDFQQEHGASLPEALQVNLTETLAVLAGQISGNPEAQYDDPAAPGFVAPAQGVTRYPMGEGVLPFDFTPSAEDANKGTVVNADGSKIKAGTYVTASGHEIAVQPGGKASIKVEDLT